MKRVVFPWNERLADCLEALAVGATVITIATCAVLRLSAPWYLLAVVPFGLGWISNIILLRDK